LLCKIQTIKVKKLEQRTIKLSAMSLNNVLSEACEEVAVTDQGT